MSALPGVAVGEGEVVIWRVGLNGSPDAIAAAEAQVSDAERERAGRYLRERDRGSFLLQRAALRRHLAALLGVGDPRRIEFAHNERGKPRVAGGGGGLEFNASGSGEVGLMAFSRGRPVGVDVERYRDIEELELAENFFAVEETAELRALPAEWRREGFFNAWTRKEAFIKALGQGLYFPLDRFAVSLAPGAVAELRRIEGEGMGMSAGDWTLAAVRMEPGYAAAVVRKGGAFALRLFQEGATGER